MDKKLLTSLVFGFVAVTAFSLTPLATKVAVQDLSPLMATAIRVIIASIFCGLYLVLSRAEFPRWQELKVIVLLALIGLFAFAVLLALGLQTAPASHAAVTMAITPLLTGIGVTMLMGERTTKTFWIAAISGTALTVFYLARHVAGHLALGDIYLLASAMAAAYGYARGTLLARSRGGPWVTSWSVVLSAPAFIIYIIASGGPNLEALRPDTYAALFYLGIISQSLGMFLWFRCLASGYAALVSQTQMFQPFLSLIFARLLLGETIGADLWLTCAGVAACFATATYARVFLGRRATSVRPAHKAQDKAASNIL